MPDQRLTFLVVGYGWLALGLLNLLVLVPGRTGWSQVATVPFGCAGLGLGVVWLRRARSLRG